MVTGYSTQMPDSRLLGVKITTKKTGEYDTTTTLTYEIDGKTVTRKQAEAAYEAQPEEWQRGRTFSQMIAFWMGHPAPIR